MDKTLHEPTSTGHTRPPSRTGRRGAVGVERRWLTDTGLTSDALRLMLALETYPLDSVASDELWDIAAALEWTSGQARDAINNLLALRLIRAFHDDDSDRTLRYHKDETVWWS